MLVVQRSPGNPLIVPSRGEVFRAVGAFNPSVVEAAGVRHMFYRAHADPDPIRTPGRAFSTIGYSSAADAVSFGEHQQVISPSESWDEYGCEDPRATFFEGKWYVFYTALGGYPFAPGNIKVAVAIGDAPNVLTEKHLVTPFNAKAATLFPERVNGEVLLLLTAHTDHTDEHPRPTIAIARAKNVEDFWNEEYWREFHDHLADHALPDVRRADSEHMEVAATPIKTPWGWLLVYSHIQDYYDESRRIFGVEALLLDNEDPKQIRARTRYPFIVPEESYEKYGLVPNVVFPTATLLTGNRLDIYYGAADTSIAMASLSFPDLIDTMTDEGRMNFTKRVPENPILEPIAEHPWESRAVFNAAALDLDGSVHMLYRAMGEDNTSVLGYARLEDAVHVTERLPEPVYVPRDEYEAKNGSPTGNSGCEDPRLMNIGDEVHLCYTAYDGVRDPHGAHAMISKEDFIARRWEKWTMPRPLTPEGFSDKDLCLFPEKIDGQYVVIHRLDPNICLDMLDTLPSNEPVNRCIELMGPRVGMWDDQKIGAAGPPIRVGDNWLFIYHGVSRDKYYRLGAALLDASGTMVIARTVAPILEPVLEWEKIGQIGNVVFSCGAVIRDGMLYIYYGGADTSMGVATVPVDTLLKKLQPML